MMMIHAKVKPEYVNDVEAAAKAMFSAIERARPKAVRYAACRVGDNFALVIVPRLEQGAESRLASMPEFRSFQEILRGWLAEPTAPESRGVVGSYNLL